MTEHRVPALSAAAEILRSLAALDAEGASLSDLVRHTGRAKSTMFNILEALSVEGLVVRDSDSLRYHLGPELISLGAAAARRIRPLGVALDHVPLLVGQLGLSIALVQPVGAVEAIVVDGVTPPSGLHVGITIGDRYGPLDGAVGKLLLAVLPEERAAEIIGRDPLEVRTPRTITEPDELLEDVRSVALRGWSSSIGEYNENNAAASAVRDPSGRASLIVVALGFAGQLSEERIPEVAQRLRDLTDRITAETGGQVPAWTSEVVAP